MTREEYFKELKNNIQSLSLDEQNEALQYYSDYFDDAGNDEKAMDDLGSPEEVAKEIREKFSNALVKQGKSEEKSDSSANGKYDAENDALYFSFDKAGIKNIDFGFGAAEVAFIAGNAFSVETRGLTADSLNCGVLQNGTLSIKNTKKLECLRFWNHDRRTRVVPRILISIPSNAEVELVRIALGAGKLTSKDISLKYQKGIIEVGAGNLVLKNLQGTNTDIRCGMGNLEIEGQLYGKTNVDCGMGAVKLNLSQNTDSCSYDAQVGLGSFRFNDFKKGGIGNCSVTKNENHFSVNVGMGDVSIFTK